MTVWFTSDNHFGHERIIELCGRPFSSVEEMNEVMVERWNARVKPRDSVYHLGDVAMGKRHETLQIVKRLKGLKFLVAGNHDKCWSGHKKVGIRERALYTEVGFNILPRETTINLDGRTLNMCHLPYVGDSHHDERYTQFRPFNDGRWLLCGHVHEAWAVQDRQINVGVDVRDYYPISSDEVLALIA